jgi:hypothetical protein
MKILNAQQIVAMITRSCVISELSSRGYIIFFLYTVYMRKYDGGKVGHEISVDLYVFNMFGECNYSGSKSTGTLRGPIETKWQLSLKQV